MVCGGFCEERKPAAGGWEHLLTDAHAHIGSMAEVEERLNSRIPSMVSAGYPQEAGKLEDICRRKCH